MGCLLSLSYKLCIDRFNGCQKESWEKGGKDYGKGCGGHLFRC